MIDPRKTPCSQSKASVTSGTVVRRRPPNRIAEIGTPAGSSHSGAIDGHWLAGAVKRAFGWAAGLTLAGVHGSPCTSVVFAGGPVVHTALHGLPCQSVASAGGSGVSPSHHTSPSAVSAVLV